MLPTYVFGWPTGQEKGAYLAVDLGGTNLRVCHVELEGDGKFEVTQTKYRLCVSNSSSSSPDSSLLVAEPRSKSKAKGKISLISAPSVWDDSFRITTATTTGTSSWRSRFRWVSRSATLACESRALVGEKEEGADPK